MLQQQKEIHCVFTHNIFMKILISVIFSMLKGSKKYLQSCVRHVIGW